MGSESKKDICISNILELHRSNRRHPLPRPKRTVRMMLAGKKKIGNYSALVPELGVVGMSGMVTLGSLRQLLAKTAKTGSDDLGLSRYANILLHSM